MGKAKLRIQTVVAVFLFWAIPAVAETPLETVEGHVHQVLGVLQDPAPERKTKFYGAFQKDPGTGMAKVGFESAPHIHRSVQQIAVRRLHG
jgi:hypothetical protein